jgi:hypothetical protein
VGDSSNELVINIKSASSLNSGAAFLPILTRGGLSNNAKLRFHTILANIFSFLHHLF